MSKLTIDAAHDLINKLRDGLEANDQQKDLNVELPLKTASFSGVGLDDFAVALANAHIISDVHLPVQLLERLSDNEKILNAVRKLLVEAIQGGKQISPASEWLIDNFYLVEEQIHTAKHHLPESYCESLPQVVNGGHHAMVRVYEIIVQLVSHTDGKIDEETLNGFIKSYQSVATLNLGELWAIPIMLRLTLIENLRRIGALIAIDRLDVNLAIFWAAKFQNIYENDPGNLLLMIGEMARQKLPIGSAFVSEIIDQVNGMGDALKDVHTWVAQRLMDENRTIQEVIAEETAKQKSYQTSISNSIGTLKLLASIDWRDFVEANSIVEQTLRKERTGIYAAMDFPTRDSYRHVVSYLAEKAGRPEQEIARIAVRLADENQLIDQPISHNAHVGYFLIGKGRQQTKKEAGISNSIGETLNLFLKENRLNLYLGSIFVITAALSTLLLFKAYGDNEFGNWLLIVIGLLLVLSASQLAITVVNFFSTLLVKPYLLPRMDFSDEIPEEFTTLVIVPALLTNKEEIETLVEGLEVHFLANRASNLLFGLLTDFTDAPNETQPEDDQLLGVVKAGICALKAKYETTGQEIFFLFHRPRSWNAVDKIWMAYERKRGKLGDLNNLLLGNSTGQFSVIIGNIKTRLPVKYVITLDAETHLPRGSAWKMVATMAHPLNKAIYNEKKKRVTEGYGVLQPRLTVSLPETRSSLYSKLHGNEPGINPYMRASSDIYQDAFEEGSYFGKGIYEVAIFEQALNHRFKENTILSSDLLEGSYIRSGLLSDVVLFEPYPATYQQDMKRKARWIRGDWQVFSWFLPFVKAPDDRLIKNPLSNLARWKVFDNIRRSLIPIALTALIILGWTVLKSPIFWTIAVSGIILFPILIPIVWDAFQKSKDVVLTQHIRVFLRNTKIIFSQTFISVICLPYEAYVSIWSIGITFWRMMVSRKNLQQWTLSSTPQTKKEQTLDAAYRTMWFAPFLTVAMLAFQGIFTPMNLFIAGPIVLLWAISPLLTWLSGQRLPKKRSVLTEDQNHFLRIVARKTWGYFEQFSNAENNWLPPDNFQQYPTAVVAKRTSPTNIGLSLLANLTAHDFGYLTTNALLKRIDDTMKTLLTMERFHGHFLNWYNTETLEPLSPKYISTVDSGNLAGHLLTLRQGLFELTKQPVIHTKKFEGLVDTWRVIQETIGEEGLNSVVQFPALLEKTIAVPRTRIPDYFELLNQLSASFNKEVLPLHSEKESIGNWWINRLSVQLSDMLTEGEIFTPWTGKTPIPEKFASRLSLKNADCLTDFKVFVDSLLMDIPLLGTLENTAEEQQWLAAFGKALAISQSSIGETISAIDQLGQHCLHLSDMEWSFLYDGYKNLLSIGYNLVEHICDPGFYDLLASEARLGVYVAIAQGKLPEDSWFALGRQLTNVEGHSILLSWSGSMFEYLMPLLVMPTYENTLLDQTYQATVKRQIDFGRQHGKPWGISESGYNMVDANANYQYKAFGVPGLGLKRGLEDDSVVAPYASALSLMVLPEEACKNMELLASKGFEGDYGFFEAIDYTPARLPPNQTYAIVQSFMAHHEGMSLLAIGYLLNGQPMQRRFEAEPQFQAALLLLQERIPKASSFYAHTTHITDYSTPTTGNRERIINTAATAIPEIQLLSNNRYHSMLTNAGGGYSRWNNLAITRWREDVTCDNWGTFCYIRDVESGDYWSNTFNPTNTQGENFNAVFSQGRVDFHNSQNGITAHTEIVVSPDDDIELRRIKITNKSSATKTIEVTSYAEVVIADAASDNMQQAFSNLFVQTEILAAQQAIICTRRPRAAGEQPPWMFHSMAMQQNEKAETSFETDRMEFLGHGNTVANPQAMTRPGPLSNSMGSVLDPIVSIRQQQVLTPGETITFDLIIGIADTRAACENLITKYGNQQQKDGVFDLAWTHSQVVLRQVDATEVEEQLFGKLAGSIIYANKAMRADASVILQNKLGQSGLWGYSISGDLPIVLLQIENQENIDLVKDLIKAHNYWRAKGLLVDLVIWNEDLDGYRQVFLTQIQDLIPQDLIDKPGGVFVRSIDQLSKNDRILFQTVARVIIKDRDGSLADFLKKEQPSASEIPYLPKVKSPQPAPSKIARQEDLQFFNGSGGFSEDGSEYIITVNNQNRTPAPWVNVIANPVFGTVISESGQAYTWMENAHELRLTPWNNDPVTDNGGEIFYLRDEDTGNFWSATPLPAGGETNYTTKHGFGYSIFEHSETGIYSEMTTYVDIELPVKFTTIKIRNDSGRTRHLSITGYCEWVLGDLRSKTAMNVITEIDPITGAFFSKNPYSTEFAERVAFFDTDEEQKTFTGDRTEFIGRNNSLQNPDAMQRLNLSGATGAAFDPCAASQACFNLAAGEEKEIVFRLGAGANAANASDIVTKTRGLQFAREALAKARKYWMDTTGIIKLETPDAAVNTLANGWLNYQSLSCRLWGRSGFYQSGGAFGFRDQLQDVLSLLFTRPALARKQILLCTAHQFQEGDVQHWWHPPTGKGVRTRISDDYLWLPFVVSVYVTHTADTEMLGEKETFLQGRLLKDGEDSYYELPQIADESASVYEHCVRAIKHGLNFGAKGLPLMETGDWNDGMDRVGAEGKGESIWLAFFLYDVLNRFIPIAHRQNDPAFAEECKNKAEKLKVAINQNGWDGEWYRRAYFDDGSPLGSSTNTDCQMDSIAQSWSVLSNGGDPTRAKQAMESVVHRLVNKEAGIIQLLDPPFDKGKESPGYIKGYVPGVRENGGQYTHAAVWMIMAFAKLGDRKRTWELLQLINPINHGSTAKQIATYKVEPYVVAGDVYSRDPHQGRGGWTWYTGSASWMYQLIVDSFVGLCKEGETLKFKPCLPEEWDSVKIHYLFGETTYYITIEQRSGNGESTVTTDGLVQREAILKLMDDQNEHEVLVVIYDDEHLLRNDGAHLNTPNS